MPSTLTQEQLGKQGPIPGFPSPAWHITPQTALTIWEDRAREGLPTDGLAPSAKGTHAWECARAFHSKWRHLCHCHRVKSEITGKKMKPSKKQRNPPPRPPRANHALHGLSKKTLVNLDQLMSVSISRVSVGTCISDSTSRSSDYRKDPSTPTIIHTHTHTPLQRVHTCKY